MPNIPRDTGLDSTWAFLRDPYRFISTRSKFHQSPVFQTRLILQKTLCLTVEGNFLGTRQGVFCEVVERRISRKLIATLNQLIKHGIDEINSLLKNYSAVTCDLLSDR